MIVGDWEERWQNTLRNQREWLMRSELKTPPSRGHQVRSRQVAGLSLIETNYPARLTMPPHDHPLAAFGLVLQGTYTERLGARSRTCRPGTLVFHPPGEEHSVVFHDTPVRIFRVNLPPSWLELMREHCAELSDSREMDGGRPTGLAVRLYREFLDADSAAGLAINGLALEVLAGFVRHQPILGERQRPSWLRRAEEFIRSHFAKALSLQTIANEVSVHPAHLARAFRRSNHCSIGQYVRRLRVEYACRALTNSAAPLAAIAVQAGFSDQSHFTRVFRQHVGLTPNAFRALRSPR